MVHDADRSTENLESGITTTVLVGSCAGERGAEELRKGRVGEEGFLCVSLPPLISSPAQALRVVNLISHVQMRNACGGVYDAYFTV